MSSSYPNALSATETNNCIVGLCIFCYKSADPASVQVKVDLEWECEQHTKSVIIVDKFLKLLGRFVGQECGLIGQKNEFRLKCANKRLSCCGDCMAIISAFSGTYEKLKCLEMELEWRLSTLVDIMKLASRVPSRNKQLRLVFEDVASENNGDGDFKNCASLSVDETMAGGLESFRNFKHDLIKNCTLRLSKSQPRVLVKRMADTKTDEFATSCMPVWNRRDEGNHISVPWPYSGMEPFLGMILSFAAVLMLTSSTVDLTKSSGISSGADDEALTSRLPESQSELDLSDVEEKDDGFQANNDAVAGEDDDDPYDEEEDNVGMTIQLSSRDEYVADFKEEMRPSSPNLVQGILDHCRSLDNDDQLDDSVDADIVSQHENIVITRAGHVIVPIPGVMSIHSTDSVSLAGKVKPDHPEFMELQTADREHPSKTPAVKSPFKCHTKTTRLKSSLATTVHLFRCGICNVSFKLYKYLRDHRRRSKRHKKLHELQKWQREKSHRVSESKTGAKSVEGPVGDESEKIPELSLKTEHLAEASLEKESRPSTPAPQRYSLRSNRKRSYRLYEGDDQDNESNEGVGSDFESDFSESSSSSDGETEKQMALPQIRQKVDMCSTDPKQIVMKDELLQESKVGQFGPTIEESDDYVQEDDREEKTAVVIDPCRGLRTLSCPFSKCKLWFTTAQTLETHKKLHGNFKCRFCDEVKDYAPSLALHETRHSSADEITGLASKKSSKAIHCSRCFRRFERKGPFIYHFLKAHLNLSGACRTCPICSAESVTKDRCNRKQHFISHHKTDGVDPSKILRCDQCPAYFLRSTQLLTHKYKIHFNEKCPECGKKYHAKKHVVATMLSHMDQIHPEHNAFPHLVFRCKLERCRERKRFATEQELKMHKERHHDLEEQVIKCKECAKEFTGLMRLKCHVKNVHGPAIHVCPECGRAFKSLMGLHNHKVYHKGPDAWKFQCSTCGRKFAARQKLNQHMRTHTKEKPFVCQFCGTQYAHRHNWRNHVKTQHPHELTQTEDVNPRSSSAFGKGMSRKGSKKGDCILAGVRQV